MEISQHFVAFSEYMNFVNSFRVSQLYLFGPQYVLFKFSPMLFYEFLKSVNSNFTLAVHSPKPNQAKTHFLSHHNVSM